MTTAGLLRQVRRGEGLSQRSLASLAGLTQPALADIERSAHDTGVETLERIVHATGYRLFALPTLRGSAAEWADAIYQELRSDRKSEEVAFRCLIGLSDDLISVSEPLRVALSVTPPAPCGDARFDAGVAAVVDFHLSNAHLPVPTWATEETRTLAEVWNVSPHADPSDIPDAFKRHGVFLAESESWSV